MAARTAVTAVTRWERNGDHHLDGDRDTEGKVVRYYRRPDIPGDTPCARCSRIMNDHGWIDSGEDGFAVCPGDVLITLEVSR